MTNFTQKSYYIQLEIEAMKKVSQVKLASLTKAHNLLRVLIGKLQSNVSAMVIEILN